MISRLTKPFPRFSRVMMPVDEVERGPLPLSHDYGVDGGAREEQVTGNEGRVVSTREDECIRQHVLDLTCSLERRVDVGREAAGDPDRVRFPVAEVVLEDSRLIQAEVYVVGLVVVQLERGAHTLHAQRLYA
jgi:hypothetical protein